MSETTEWLSTAGTVAAAVVAWGVYRQTTLARRPIIEHRMSWDNYPGVGPILRIDFNITNNLNRRLEIEEVWVKQRGWKIISNVRQAIDVIYWTGRKIETVTRLPLRIMLTRKGGDGAEPDTRLLPSRVEETIYALPPESLRSDSSLSIKIRCSRNSFAVFRTFATTLCSIPQQSSDMNTAKQDHAASDGR